MKSLSRRDFLRRTSALSLLGSGAPLALTLAGIGNAAAAGAGDYKALICVYLTGGNDSYNTVLATDTDSWSAYSYERSRDADGIGLRPVGTPANKGASQPFADQLGGVLAISPKRPEGRTFALHPSMSGVRDLFASGRLAVVSNVGPMIQPITKADYLNGIAPRPAHLFSHNDQRSTWQSLAVEGSTSGWGGRLVERFLSGNTTSMFSSISTAGSAVWVNGQQLKPYQMAPSGVITIGGGAGGTLYGSTVAQQKLLDVMTRSRATQLMAQDHTTMAARSTEAATSLSGLFPVAAMAPWGTPGVVAPAVDPLLQYVDPDTGLPAANRLALELQTVARMISARGALGMTRQVFFVSLEGFDTHSGQARTHASLVAQLSHAFSYLDSTLNAMGVAQNVTAFTASDFGRSFTSNGDGTDHGWGGHQFVLGGAVRGGDIYGRFPVYSTADTNGVFGSDDQLANGVMLPQVSVDQYGATLAQWFGVSATDALGLFPNLHNFTQRNLGFMA